jgi:hypothetical protein
MFSLEILEIERKRVLEEDSRRLQIPLPESELKPKTQKEDEPKRVIIIEL